VNDLGNYRPISLLNTIYKLFAAVVKRRLESKLDKYLQDTQFGFRKHRGTADALQCVRRIIDKGEMTGSKTLLVLLEWEKAFDKVNQEGLFKALQRMNVPAKFVNIIKSMYNEPSFFVEIEGYTSAIRQQESGIRQGCPLSPYLFIVLMTVLFHDVYHHTDRKSQRRHMLTTNRVKGANFDAVLYADDTICVSDNETTMNKLLKVLEDE